MTSFYDVCLQRRATIQQNTRKRLKNHRPVIVHSDGDYQHIEIRNQDTQKTITSIYTAPYLATIMDAAHTGWVIETTTRDPLQELTHTRHKLIHLTHQLRNPPQTNPAWETDHDLAKQWVHDLLTENYTGDLLQAAIEAADTTIPYDASSETICNTLTNFIFTYENKPYDPLGHMMIEDHPWEDHSEEWINLCETLTWLSEQNPLP